MVSQPLFHLSLVIPFLLLQSVEPILWITFEMRDGNDTDIIGKFKEKHCIGKLG